MSMKTLRILSALLFIVQIHTYAQKVPAAYDYHELALLFSQYEYVGSARIQGLANTQISLGGDISSALSNPAGLGFYNKSEFTITPSFNVLSNESSYLNNSTDANKGRFNIEGFGVVFNRTKDDLTPGKWRGGSFAISFNKVNEFHSQIKYGGENVDNDMLDYLVQSANEAVDNGYTDTNTWPSLPYLAYETYLLDEYDDGSGNGFYNRLYFAYPSEEYPATQREVIKTKGSQNQWNFSYGGNFADRFYFGAGLGITSVNYEIEKNFQEYYPESDLLSTQVIESSEVNGSGINATFGIIARPLNFITIGLSAVTPTYIGLNEFTVISMQANYNGVNYNGEYLSDEYAQDDPIDFDYYMTTPWKLNAGMSVFLGKHGFISGDVQWINYSAMDVGASDYDMDYQDEIISASYENVMNYSVGGEARLGHFRARAGYRYIGNPYQDKYIDKSQTNISAGLGYRNSEFFLDLAVTYMTYKTDYSPYYLYPPDAVELYLQQDIDSDRYPSDTDDILTDAVLDTYTPKYVDIESKNISVAVTFGLLF